MQSFPINWLALLVVTVVKFVLGFVWFGLIFGKQWQALSGVSEAAMKAGMVKAIVTDLVTTFILAFVLVHAIHYAGAASLGTGAAVGFFNWLGFVGTLTLASTVYEQRPLKLWVIGNAYQLLSLVIMGAVLAIWT
jgi:hypothetical protein